MAKPLPTVGHIKSSITVWTTIGGAVLGYLILHPYAMIVYLMYERKGLDAGALLREVTLSFNVRMLPMGLPFAALGALAGFFLGLWLVSRKRRTEALRQMELLEKQLGHLNRGE